jgi:SAM-dependent methyltransferase
MSTLKSPDGAPSIYAANLRRHYQPRVAEHGGTFRAVDWGSEKSQTARFRVLLEATDFRSARILDVGCGVGHLVDHLAKEKFDGAYLGVDLVPEMVAAARRRHCHSEFREGGPEAGPEYHADLVVGSGLFTFADQARLERTVVTMFHRARRVVAFNTLSTWADSQEDGEFYADPMRVIEFCRTLTNRVVLRHDYMPHDFTIYLYHPEDKA